MKKRIIWGVIWGALFAGFTCLVKTYDVAPIGPQGTEVGFSHINQHVHALTGVNMNWFESTELLGYAAIGVAALFALVGLVQLISRKSLRKVDSEIIGLGVLFVIVIGLYVLFDIVVINYRPVVMPGDTYPEPSYPSSHTMLIITVMGATIMLLKRYLKKGFLRGLIWFVLFLTILVTIGGRLYSGVHWATDIAGGVILSASLLDFYEAYLCSCRNHRRHAAHEESASGDDGYFPKH